MHQRIAYGHYEEVKYHVLSRHFLFFESSFKHEAITKECALILQQLSQFLYQTFILWAIIELVHQVYWFLTLSILYIPISALNQQQLNALSRPDILAALHSQVQSTQPLRVDSVYLAVHSYYVAHGQLCAREGCPMQGCAVSFVAFIDVQALAHEIYEGGGLVALGCDVQHVDCLLVLGSNVCTKSH